ncbi:hypothetical protein J6590_050786 [Homalodisca vitripennis]|nr:hypothetical protein J6590_050786 [Homalodisca vitripennis]
METTAGLCAWAGPDQYSSILSAWTVARHPGRLAGIFLRGRPADESTPGVGFSNSVIARRFFTSLVGQPAALLSSVLIGN